LPTSEAEAAGADNTYNCRVAGKKKREMTLKKQTTNIMKKRRR